MPSSALCIKDVMKHENLEERIYLDYTLHLLNKLFLKLFLKLTPSSGDIPIRKPYNKAH